MVIRPAGSEDEPFLREMQYEALFVPPGAPPFAPEAVDDPGIRRYYAGFGSLPGDVGFVAETERGPIGAVWARLVQGYGFVDERTPEIGLAVVAAERGRGVGSALLSALVEVVPRCSLCVDMRNPARRLYRRFDFVEVRRDGEFASVMLREPL
ncbi:MAG: GNAT family N-acetyltransferase [Ilumatobacter sp.]|uniref:GNAT family N-acetyltransferase n=1 Tax=Ilumatobacter sp. TaxID=1967498 RepID=UPI0026049001|nr:GNAT family N-acetyltransferase [Ilumatobacter sp.]MDJ0770888.1 GNAT family N-acetyltransferase [Ilumatobacter sp.]